MAIKHQLTINQLNEFIREEIDEKKLATNSFNETHENIVGLLDTIGKIITLDTSFTDKLSELDADYLPYGKTVEEYYQDLILPFEQGAVDDNEVATLKYYSPTYRPVSYSYRIGEQVIAQSILRYDVERAVNNAQQLQSVVATQYKRMSDSKAVFKYGLKRELLGRVGEKIEEAYKGATAYVKGTTEIVEGTYYSSTESTLEKSTYGTGNSVYFVAVKSYDGKDRTIDELVTDGVLIPLTMYVKIKKPADAETGSAFILKVKELVEKARDVSEGFSFNGNTIGTEEGLSFYVAQGIVPNLEVNTLAGIYHLDQMGMGVTAKTIKDFGSNPAGIYALLMDTRGAKLYIDHEYVDDQKNALKEFINLFDHGDYTPFISRNTFFVCFVDDTEE